MAVQEIPPPQAEARAPAVRGDTVIASWIDLQEAVAGAVKGSVGLLPPTIEALPEQQAWAMIYAEWGVLGALAAVVITVLWRLLAKFIEETRAQNIGLVSAQASAIKMLSEAVLRVEHAVQLSDNNNTHALKTLTENLGAVSVRQDRHEARLERHSDRISVMEVERRIEERTAQQRNGVAGRESL